MEEEAPHTYLVKVCFISGHVLRFFVKEYTEQALVDLKVIFASATTLLPVITVEGYREKHVLGPEFSVDFIIPKKEVMYTEIERVKWEKKERR